MKKRLLALVCASVMVMGMSLTASAAGSVTAEEIKKAEEEVADAQAGTTVTVTEDKIVIAVENSEVKVELPVSTEAREESAVAAEKVIVKDAAPAGAVITPVAGNKVPEVAAIATEITKVAVKAKKVETKFVVDLHADAAGTFKFNIALGSNEKAYIYHYVDGGVEIIPCTSDGKSVSFDMKKYSTVALVVVTDTAATTPAATPETTTTTATETTVVAQSPKTGDVTPIVAMMAMVSGMGLVGLKRTKKN